MYKHMSRTDNMHHLYIIFITKSIFTDISNQYMYTHFLLLK